MKNLSYRKISRQFVWFFLPTAFVLLLLSGLAIHTDTQHHLVQIEVEEVARVDVARKMLGRELRSIITDIRLIAGNQLLRNYMQSGSETDRKRLVEILTQFSQEKGLYDQIRYLDLTGQEIVRINFKAGKAKSVREEELQNKGQRYYFTEAMKLHASEIYLSRMDLNIEKGKIEIPKKPMMRFVTPLYSDSGGKHGLLVLNYLASDLLEHYKDVMIGGGIPMLVDRDGYILSGSEHEKEWGMMHKGGFRFAERYPEIWKMHLQSTGGTLLTDEGLFVYGVVIPVHKDILKLGEGYPWLIVSLVPAANLPNVSINRYPYATLLVFVGFVLLAVGSWYLARARVNRHAWQQALKESESRFRAIFQEAGFGIALVGKDKKVLQANPALEGMLGYAPGELMGKNVVELFQSQEQQKTAKELDDVILHDETANSGDYRLVVKEGGELAGHILFSTIHDTYGAPKFALILVDDITERINTAARERELQAQLAHMGRVGIMGELTSTLAHELNNPLGTISNYATSCINNIKNGAEAGSLTPMLEKIWHQAHLAGDIIRQVRQFVSRSVPVHGSVELLEAVIESIAFLDGHLDRVNTTVSCDICAHLPQVAIHKTQLEQVILNLLLNAIDAVKEEEERQIWITAVHEENGMVKVSVKDNGPISTVPEQLFEPLYTSKQGGLGMGLSICRTLVESHGGKIWASIESDHGLNVHFTLPLVIAQQDT